MIWGSLLFYVVFSLLWGGIIWYGVDNSRIIIMLLAPRCLSSRADCVQEGHGARAGWGGPQGTRRVWSLLLSARFSVGETRCIIHVTGEEQTGRYSKGPSSDQRLGKASPEKLLFKRKRGREALSSPWWVRPGSWPGPRQSDPSQGPS